MNRNSVAFIMVLLVTLIINCANNPENKYNQIIKLNYRINKETGDSCLIEKTTYHSDHSTFREKYNYYNCSKDLVYKAHYKDKVLKEQEYFNLKSYKPKIKYLYSYNEFGHLSSIILRDIELNKDVKTIINSSYNQKGNIKQQIYIDSNRKKFREIHYKYDVDNNFEKIDSNILDHTVIRTFFLNGNKIKEVKSGKTKEWRYADSGKLKEYKKNPFCKDVYIYGENNKLLKVNCIIKKKSGNRIIEKEKYSYYSNDSIKTKIINENSRRTIENRFYYYLIQ